jgi:hypothetical protein
MMDNKLMLLQEWEEVAAEVTNFPWRKHLADLEPVVKTWRQGPASFYTHNNKQQILSLASQE